ncbi:MAG: hypothetical protein ACYC6L_08500 [Anaerolineae bacterium]
MAAVAAQKGIAPQRLDAVVERTTEECSPWKTEFAVRIDIGPGLTSRERIILYNSARQCEVHKLLSGQVTFSYALVEPEAD